MPRFDLHSHSTRSDGLLTPRELVARAAQNGVTVLALTDHDEVGGVSEARTAAGLEGIALVNGVEISVTWNGHTLHVVGLHVDPGCSELVAGLEHVRSGRRSRAEGMASSLAQAGIAGSLEGARSYAANPELVSRTHFARFLVERGHSRDVQSVFKKYLVSGRPGYVSHQWASLEQAVGWIRASGGMPVIAHPGRYKLDNPQREMLLANSETLAGLGSKWSPAAIRPNNMRPGAVMRGVSACSPRRDPITTARARAIAISANCLRCPMAARRYGASFEQGVMGSRER